MRIRDHVLSSHFTSLVSIFSSFLSSYVTLFQQELVPAILPTYLNTLDKNTFAVLLEAMLRIHQ